MSRDDDAPVCGKGDPFQLVLGRPTQVCTENETATRATQLGHKPIRGSSSDCRLNRVQHRKRFGRGCPAHNRIARSIHGDAASLFKFARLVKPAKIRRVSNRRPRGIQFRHERVLPPAKSRLERIAYWEIGRVSRSRKVDRVRRIHRYCRRPVIATSPKTSAEYQRTGG